MPHEFQLRRILAATDLSSRSDRALRRAAMLAQASGAGLAVLHGVDDDQPSSLVRLEREEAARLLHDQIAAVADLGGVRLAPMVEMGDPHEVILHFAESHAADLIVMGEHRRRGVRDWFGGTTVERVTRRGRRPVLMVHQPPARPYRRVLVATDFSPHATRALRASIGFGLLAGAEIFLLHAHEGPGMRGIGLAHLPEDQARALVAAEDAAVRTRLEEYAGGLPLPQAPVLLVEEGRAGAAITQAAERLRPDLLVVGKAGAGLVRHALLGSVAAEVLGAVDCDVLTVPPGDGG